MAKHSIIAQKLEKNRRIAAREKLDRVSLRIVGDPHKHWDYEVTDTTTVRTVTTQVYGVIITEEDPELGRIDIRERIVEQRRAPERKLTRRRVHKWGKWYWAYYNGVNLVKLVRIG